MSNLTALKSGEKRWTKAQRAAMDFDGKGLLLSAGAGSGKTATLTEKVARLVCDADGGVPVREIIIVTFTKAAAGELRDRIGRRIREKLRESPSSDYLTRQLVDLECAEISTISSFFSRAIRPFFKELGLSPSFRVEEESAMNVLKKAVMGDVIDSFFDTDDRDFSTLADCFSSSRDEERINDVLLEIAELMTRKGIDAEKMALWASDYEAMAEKDFFLSPHGRTLWELTKEFSEHYLRTYTYYAEELSKDEKVMRAYGENISESIRFLSALAERVKSAPYTEIRESVLSFTLPSLGKNTSKSTASESFKLMKDKFKADLGALKHKYAADGKAVRAAGHRAASVCRATAKVIAEYLSAYETEKKERGVVDLSDLEIYAHRVFCNADGSPTEAAYEFSKRFKYIFIDEYQDTNRIQDDIFAALGVGMKRFMVGDVKQSIYSFRGAEPAVFTSYRKKWKALGEDAECEPSGERCASVFMSDNFRSDSNVIDFVNLVSEYMFDGGDTPFEEGDKLVFSKENPDGAGMVEICVIEKSKKKNEKSKKDEKDEKEETDEKNESGAAPVQNAEFEYIASRISQMLNADGGAEKRFSPSDIAVLSRSTADAQNITRVLRRRGIPVSVMTDDEFFEQSEVLLVLCILNVIDNPFRDVYLAGAMKSPVFDFTMDDMIGIIDVRQKNEKAPLWFCVSEYAESGKNALLKEKCADFVRFVSEFRKRAPGMSAAKILSSLYDSLSLYSLAESGEAGECDRIKKNLTRLYEYARGYHDSISFGLYGFIKYIEELTEGKIDSAEKAAASDAVSVMTIHKSKGLEFPVCFLCSCQKGFNFKDAAKDFLFDPASGPAMKLRDASGLIMCETPHRASLSENVKRAAVSEEARTLYVAMTRAVSRLIVTMSVSDAAKAIAEAEERFRFPTPYSKRSAKSFSNFILPAALGAGREAQSCFEIKTIRAEDVSAGKTVSTENAADNEGTLAEEKTERLAEELFELYSERLSFEYPSRCLRNIPAKVTVSKLSPSLLDTDDASRDIGLDLVEQIQDAIDSRAADGELDSERHDVPLPRFLSERENMADDVKGKASAADVGTATHIFLQFCDFERLRSLGVEKELSRLVEKKFMSERDASLVRKDEIEKFSDTSLFRDVLASREVYREMRFNAALPASDFTRDPLLREELEKTGRDITVQGVVDLVYRDSENRIILVDYKTDRMSVSERRDRRLAEAKLQERHGVQLFYYREALERMFNERVYRTLIYSLALGDTVEINRK